MRKILSLLIVACSLALPRSGAAGTPPDTVEGFHSILLGVMKDADSLGVKERYQRLAPSIDQAFDLSRMIQIATGGYWKDADDSQRQRLTEAFRRLSIATYASQFDGFSGQAFVTDGERSGPQQTVLVVTRITDPKGQGADLTYVVKSVEGRWLIVDVLLDNAISQLAVRRSEYRQILKAGGVESLIRALDEKAESLLK